MDVSSGFPIDIVLFGMIAAFLVLRLRSILGRRSGYERPAQPLRPGMPQGPVIEGVAEAPPSARPLPDPASTLGQTLAQMKTVAPSFDPARFLDGAEQAFRMIVGAFAAGDRVALRPLLTDETYRSFETAIAAREQAGETQRTEIRSIASATVEEAALRGRVAEIGVRFVSDQVNVTLGRDNQPVAGNDAVTEIHDLWTFERDLVSRDPTWRLAAAQSA